MASEQFILMGSTNSDHKTHEFLELAKRLGMLKTEQIEAVRRSSQASGVTPIQLVLQQGLLDPVAIDIIETLRRPTDVIPGYELLDVLGRGGMGVVYRARQVALNRQVAIKTILINRMEDQRAINRFEQEAQVVAQLSHPNIVGAFDYGRHQGRLYLVMEYVDGTNLERDIEDRGAISEWEAWGLARQAAAGLAHASAQGIVHRDIKPGNLLLVDAPRGMPLPAGLKMIKIADFGLARLTLEQDSRTRITTDNTAVGSPQYMAPEQLHSGPVDLRADIYSLGATVYHMLAGMTPFSGNLTQVLTLKMKGEYMPLAETAPGVSQPSRELVDRLMSLHPEDRPGDYSQVIEEIDQVLAGFRPSITSPALMLPLTLDESTLGRFPANLPGRSISTGQQETAILNDPGHLTHPTSTYAPQSTGRSDLPATAKSGGAGIGEAHRWIVPITVTVIGVLVLLSGFFWLGSGERVPNGSSIVPETPTPQMLEEASPPRPLFNGHDLLGWQIESGAWRSIPEEGVIAGSGGELWTTLFESAATPRPIEFYKLEFVVHLRNSDRVEVLFGIAPSADRHGARHVLSLSPSQVSLLEREIQQAQEITATRATLDDQIAPSREAFVRLERQPLAWFLYLDDRWLGWAPHRDVPDLPEFRFVVVGHEEAWFSDVVITPLSANPAAP